MDERGRSICEVCATTVRRCAKCGKEMPGGRGRVCMECAARNGLARKKRFGMGALSNRTAKAFETFADWFEKKRGPQVASLRLLEYLPFFMDIGSLEERLGRLPLYWELADVLSVKRIWENRLAMEFLDGSGLIKRDVVAQKEIAERDMIERYLGTFSEQTFFAKALGAYLEKLETKMLAGKTTIRSIRLALTPAKRFLEYCSYCGKDYPDQESLEGYLWIYPGQKNALMGFVNFLNEHFKTGLDIRSVEKPKLCRPRSSRKYLEQRLIRAMQDENYLRNIGKDKFLRIAIGYLHWVDVPKNVNIGFATMRKESMQFAGHVFFIPKDVTKSVRQNTMCNVC